MIGNFEFADEPNEESIRVRMHREADTKRAGVVEIPASIFLEMIQANYPSVQDSMPLESALGYAIVIAAKTGRDLCLTGDPSAWNPAWGRLLAARAPANSQ